jgi:hypothetical protein
MLGLQFHQVFSEGDEELTYNGGIMGSHADLSLIKPTVEHPREELCAQPTSVTNIHYFINHSQISIPSQADGASLQKRVLPERCQGPEFRYTNYKFSAKG